MGPVRNPPKTADLFSDATARAVPVASAAADPAKTRRHILPNDLPAAVKQLNDSEFNQLLSAVLAEQERRGGQKPALGSGARKKQSEAVVPSLTIGKLNAIRAAFKAGVKPSRIARQFGLSQAEVRKALASDHKG